MRTGLFLKAAATQLALGALAGGVGASEYAHLTNPPPNSVVNSLSSLGGQVSFGAFPRAAKIAIYRLSDGRRWVPGSGWTVVVGDEISRYGDGTSTPLPAFSYEALPGIDAHMEAGPILDSSFNRGWYWRITNGPSASALTDGRYFIRTFGTAYYLSATPGAMGFYVTVDRTLPVVAITSPSSGATVAALDNVRGTAADNAGGGGLQRVSLTLRRNIDGLHWNGTIWVAGAVLLETRLTRDQWTPARPMPSGSALPNGGYMLTATVVDRTGNTAVSLPTFVTVNASETFIGFIVPRAGEVLTSFENLAGSAYDLSGVRNVDVYLQRLSDLLYWNGVSWQGDPAVLPAPFSSGIFSRSTSLPTGSQLLSGEYEIGASARGNAGGLATDVIRVRIDRTPPVSVTFDHLTDAEWIRTFWSPNGRAMDDGAGTGISRVLVTVFRESDGLYWRGTGLGWSIEPVEVPTHLTPPGPEAPGLYRWTSSEVIGGGELYEPFDVESRYRLTARAFDFAGQSVSNTIHVGVDGTYPELTISEPANRAYVRQLNSISGSASDVPSGLQEVSVSILRSSDGLYWDGGGWSGPSAGSELPTVAFAGIWLTTSGLPAPADLDEGAYWIQARATDRANNTIFDTHEIVVDKTAPSIAFSTPADGARLGVLASIAGTVTDAASGVRSMSVGLQRISDGMYWSGSSWQVAPVETSAALTGTTWQWVYGLPSGADLPEGDYRLTATAVDVAGNSSFAAVAIRIDTAYPTVTIIAPGHGTTRYCPAGAKGTATDSSGVDAVFVYLYRSVSGARPAGFFNFETASWGSDVGYVPSRANGTNIWTKDLPELDEGEYVLGAYARDNSGNVSGATTHRFDLRCPALVIQRGSPGQVVLSWPLDASCYELQYAERLSPFPTWLSESTAPMLVGEQLMVTNSVFGANRFYRLKR